MQIRLLGKKMALFNSTGKLKYHKGESYKLIVEVDPEIARYYISLIPKYIKFNTQMYKPHISVVRKEIPPNLEYWGKYEDQIVDFAYDGTIYRGEVYIWLDVYSKRLEEIRLELGLPVHSQYTLPPEGYENVFHSTIGNFKGK